MYVLQTLLLCVLICTLSILLYIYGHAQLTAINKKEEGRIVVVTTNTVPGTVLKRYAVILI